MNPKVKSFAFVAVVALLPLKPFAQVAGNPPAPSELQVQIWAASCMACHGPEGRAIGTGLTIGGRPVDELQGKLLAYKRGEIPATIMHQHAKGYSDDELARIAAYFASLK